MPTITKLNNSYRIRVSCGYDTSGKQIVKSMTWKPSPNMTARQTEKELAKVASAFESKVQNGEYTEASEMKLAEFALQYLDMQRKMLAPTTFHLYERIISEIITPTLGHIKLKDFKPFHSQRLIDAMTADGKLSAATIKRYFCVLQSIMTKAYKLELIDRNPTETAKLDLPEVEEAEVQIFSREEVKQMLSCLDAEPLKFQVLIHLAVTTGARRGELVALKWEHIDFKRSTITIKQSNYKIKGQEVTTKKPKTKGSNREIAVPSYILDMLKAFRIEQLRDKMRLGDAWHEKGFIFCKWNGEPMHPNTPTDAFADFLKRNGIPHRKFHALRHTSATLLLTSGTNIKTVGARLGHTQLATTNRYVHALRDADEAAAQTFADFTPTPKNIIEKAE